MGTKWTLSDIERLKKEGKIKDFSIEGIKKEEKKSKYGNKKTYVGDIQFDSAKEAKRYIELRYLLMSGEIKDLRLQVEFKLSVCSYVSDFTYIKNGELVVEDVKGYKTATYRMKKKLMKAELGIEILET